jgi:hypothetical protein
MPFIYSGEVEFEVYYPPSGRSGSVGGWEIWPAIGVTIEYQTTRSENQFCNNAPIKAATSMRQQQNTGRYPWTQFRLVNCTLISVHRY